MFRLDTQEASNSGASLVGLDELQSELAYVFMLRFHFCHGQTDKQTERKKTERRQTDRKKESKKIEDKQAD